MHDKSKLLAELNSNRNRALELLRTLTLSQLNVPYHPGINPPVWELGHCAYFFELFILQRLDNWPAYDPTLDSIWDSFELAHEDRWQPGLFPDLSSTQQYFEDIVSAVEQRIVNTDLTDDDLYLYRYAIYHLNMHLESLVWCRQTLAYPKPGPALAANTNTPKGSASHLGDATVPAGAYRIGLPGRSTQFATEDFGFDNEKPAFTVQLTEFKISKTLVSQGEFLEFVNAGGYENPAYWGMGGQRWLRTSEQRHPLYWRKHQGQWQVRHFNEWRVLDSDCPVMHVTWWEAQAYCAFAGRRLPTEYEWEAACLGNTEGQPFNRLPWGNTMDSQLVDMDCQYCGQLPVSALQQGAGPFGCLQMIGTAWEWTSSQFFPYDGFKKDMYPFMSTLQFGDHIVTRGGSFATASNLIRGTYRQAYLPERNDVFTSFRTCPLR